jgi:hypothetical protein
LRQDRNASGPNFVAIHRASNLITTIVYLAERITGRRMDNASTSHLPREDDVSDQSLPLSWPSTLILISLGYLALCSMLRFQRINRLQNRLGFTDRLSLNRMTVADAQEILRTSINYDFPLIYDLSLRFALIKVTFAPPS